MDFPEPYLVTAPTVEPVSLDQAKAQCRVAMDDESEDGLLEGLIRTAREWAEGFTHRVLCTQTWDLKYDRFPCAGERLELPLPPLQSVTYVKYFDPDGAEQTWSASQYDVHRIGTSPAVNPTAERGYVVPKPDYAWPTPQSKPEAVTVRVVSGYGVAAAVPQAIKQAMLLRIGQLFIQREPSITGAVVSATKVDEQLLGPYRSLRAA